MSFKFTVLAVCLLIPIAVFAGDGVPSPAESFAAAQFTNAPAPVELVLTAQAARAVQEILGHRYGKKEITYWRAEGKTVWVLDTRGRSNIITAGFVIRDGRLMETEVLIYRERRGEQVKTKAFLDQFINAGLTGDKRLDRRIDGITGATISVNAMKNMARLALYLEKLSSPQAI